jgi:hypothetical protein
MELIKARLHFLDHTRGFVILMVVAQHAYNAYGNMWGGPSYFHPGILDRSDLYDALLMWSDSYIMAALFLVSGMFVIPSLERRGWLEFTKEKIIRLVIPFFIAVYTLVPILQYVRYIESNQPDIGFITYWLDVYIEKTSLAGYWFLSLLVVFTFTAAILYTVLPVLFRKLGDLIRWFVQNPVAGILIVGGLNALFISGSDLVWGTQYWWKFSFLAARYNQTLGFIFFFILGLGVRSSGILNDHEILEKIGNSWKKWVVGTAVLSLAYMYYCVEFRFDGAFSNEFVMFRYYGGSFVDGLPILKEIAPGILVRTIMNGFLTLGLTMSTIATLYTFTNHPDRFWTSLAACSYGIYFFHEQIVVVLQHIMISFGLPIIMKVLLSFIIGAALSWTFTDKVMRRYPPFNKVF